MEEGPRPQAPSFAASASALLSSTLVMAATSGPDGELPHTARGATWGASSLAARAAAAPPPPPTNCVGTPPEAIRSTPLGAAAAAAAAKGTPPPAFLRGARWNRHTAEGGTDLARCPLPSLAMRYAFGSAQGRRGSMEDAHCTHVDVDASMPGSGFFGVYDGHGGDGAAQLCAKMVWPLVWDRIAAAARAAAAPPLLSPQLLSPRGRGRTTPPTSAFFGSPHHPAPSRAGSRTGSRSASQPHTPTGLVTPVEDYAAQAALRQAAEMVSEWPPRTNTPLNTQIEEALGRVFVDMDAFMHANPKAYGRTARRDPGCTACTVLVTRDHLVFANLGDSRAVLCRNGRPAFVTTDHKPSQPSERARIKAAGGFVLGGRVSGCLSVSRAVGDLGFKTGENGAARRPEQQPVSPIPDVTFVDRNSAEDEWLLVACDGIFDVIDNDALCAWISTRLRQAVCVEEVVGDLLDFCFDKGSSDNMTAILVCFAGGLAHLRAAAERTSPQPVLRLKRMDSMTIPGRGTAVEDRSAARRLLSSDGEAAGAGAGSGGRRRRLDRGARLRSSSDDDGDNNDGALSDSPEQHVSSDEEGEEGGAAEPVEVFDDVEGGEEVVGVGVVCRRGSGVTISVLDAGGGQSGSAGGGGDRYPAAVPEEPAAELDEAEDEEEDSETEC